MRISGPVVFIFFALLLFGMAAVMIAGTDAPAYEHDGDYKPSTMGRVHDPVQVPGSLLDDLQGAGFANLGLFSYDGADMSPVPHQFDERTPDGNFIMDMGRVKNPGDHNYKLDRRDFLVFRICDSGGRAPRSAWKTKDGVEIELIDPVDGGRSYVYLLRFPKQKAPRLDKKTMFLENWDPWEEPDQPLVVRGLSYHIEGVVNHINGKYYKTVVNKTFRVPESAGGTGVNILDGQRMRAFCEFKLGIYRIEANETNMIGGIESLRQGNVRGYGRQWMTRSFPWGIEGPRIYSDVFTYDRVIVSPMQLNIPINPGMIINRAGIEFGYDLNENAYGMKFYSPNCKEGVTIDGRMSKREKQIPHSFVPWYLITGPQGSLIFRVDIDPELLDQTKSSLTYIDDINRGFPPEDEPGSIGYARTRIEMTSVEPRLYEFQIEWYFPPDLYKPGGYDKKILRDFLNIKDAPLIITVDGESVRNRALSPPPLKKRK